MTEQNKDRKELMDKTDEVAEETAYRRSNGNRDEDDSKAGGAARGGPDIDKAQDRQPPQAEPLSDK